MEELTIDEMITKLESEIEKLTPPPLVVERARELLPKNESARLIMSNEQHIRELKQLVRWLKELNAYRQPKMACEED